MDWYNGLHAKQKQKTKTALSYYLSKPNYDFERVFECCIPPFDPPTNARDFFVWISEDLFGEESYLITDLNSYQVVPIYMKQIDLTKNMEFIDDWKVVAKGGKSYMLKMVIRKTMIVYGFIGVLIGFGLLVYSFYNKDFTYYLGEKEVHGIVSGLIAVPFVPTIMALVGFFHAIVFWFPLVYLYKKLTKSNHSSA